MMKLKKGKLLIDQHNKNYLYGGKFGGNYVPETLKKPIEDLANLFENCSEVGPVPLPPPYAKIYSGS